MLDKAEVWIAERPAARTMLPWASGAAVLLGLFLMVVGMRGGGEEPPPPPVPTAQADLEKGLAAATVYFEDQTPPTFLRFTPKIAEGIDASLTWTRSATAVDGQVAIRVAKERNVMLVSSDATGAYCIYANSDGQIRKGTGDVEKSDDCTGGW